MNIRGVVAEDFANYKLPSLFIISSVCDWKCCTELMIDTAICQNSSLMSQPVYDASVDSLYDLYHNNDITQAVVIGGLEPMLQLDDVIDLIRYFREHGEECPFVIYTGYEPDEIIGAIERLREFSHIIIKFGRYRPYLPSVYDDVLGVTLASSNQFAEEIC